MGGENLLDVRFDVEEEISCKLYCSLNPQCTVYTHYNAEPGLHKLWYPGIRDTSTWSKLGAHGEHGDVFLFSNLGAL